MLETVISEWKIIAFTSRNSWRIQPANITLVQRLHLLDAQHRSPSSQSPGTDVMDSSRNISLSTGYLVSP